MIPLIPPLESARGRLRLSADFATTEPAKHWYMLWATAMQPLVSPQPKRLLLLAMSGRSRRWLAFWTTGRTGEPPPLRRSADWAASGRSRRWLVLWTKGMRLLPRRSADWVIRVGSNS